MMRVAMVVVAVALWPWVGEAQEAPPVKERNALFPESLVAHARANADRYPWAADIRDAVVEAAAPWLAPSEDEMWAWVFGHRIERSWMVWSDGHCPACREDVKMYAWEMDPWAFPWKVQCPHCRERFPKNDFAAFHRSGLDERGIFDPGRADRSLLFNADHPDPQNPLHGFGVDDGTGYTDGDKRWRFIGAYLVYGQWKKLIWSGIVNLSSAYAVTGDPDYAYRAALLLDRLADVYPEFDFGRQGWVYETQEATRGQISTWHDACQEVRELALAYDRVFEGARAQEGRLTAYLSGKARDHGLGNPKASWADIQRNIESGIFTSTLEHPDRIRSNYPTHDVALMTIRTVLGWPGNRDEVMAALDAIVEGSTAVDGLSGEKGLAGYSTIAPRTLAEVLGLFSRLDPGFLAEVYARHPVLHRTYRFHIDTWCLGGQYLPQTGDSGAFGRKYEAYAGVALRPQAGAAPSMYSFLWDLYAVTQDPAFVQVLYRGNGNSVEGLPHDLFAADPEAVQAAVADVLEKAGAEWPEPSVNKEEWCLAVLKSGAGEHRRALWIDYDAHERHSHADGMNIGLFAKGLDLIPDFGYPPVGYGGWGSPKARWYTRTAAHATVVVDGQDQRRDADGGRTTLWADGDRFRAIRVSAPQLASADRYDRTVAMVDLDDRDSYIVDCFRVGGGGDHAWFLHSHFGALRTEGLFLHETEDYGFDTEMRRFRSDPKTEPGWTAEWTVEDRYGYLPEGREVRLRYTGLTPGVEAGTCEAWIDSGLYGGHPEWIPRLIQRRRGDSPLRSTFVGVIEPHDGESRLASVRRVGLETINGHPYGDSFVAVLVERRDGRRDLCILADGEGPVELIQPDTGVHFRGQAAHLTFGPEGLERAALCGADWLKAAGVELVPKPGTAFVEVLFGPEGPRQIAGPPGAL